MLSSGSTKQGLLTLACSSQINIYMDNYTFCAESVGNVFIDVCVYTPPWDVDQIHRTAATLSRENKTQPKSYKQNSLPNQPSSQGWLPYAYYMTTSADEVPLSLGDKPTSDLSHFEGLWEGENKRGLSSVSCRTVSRQAEMATLSGYTHLRTVGPLTDWYS